MQGGTGYIGRVIVVVEGVSGGSMGGWVVVVEVAALSRSGIDGKCVVGEYEALRCDLSIG